MMRRSWKLISLVSMNNYSPRSSNQWTMEVCWMLIVPKVFEGTLLELLQPFS